MLTCDHFCTLERLRDNYYSIRLVNGSLLLFLQSFELEFGLFPSCSPLYFPADFLSLSFSSFSTAFWFSCCLLLSWFSLYSLIPAFYFSSCFLLLFSVFLFDFLLLSDLLSASSFHSFLSSFLPAFCFTRSAFLQSTAFLSLFLSCFSTLFAFLTPSIDFSFLTAQLSSLSFLPDVCFLHWASLVASCLFSSHTLRLQALSLVIVFLPAFLVLYFCCIYYLSSRFS